MLKEVFERTDYGNFSFLEEEVFTGCSLLWVAWDGSKKISAAVVTQIRTDQKSRVCQICACSCVENGAWAQMREAIEAYAKAENCNKIRAIGRKGWARMLPDARISLYVIEKEIV